MSASPENLLGVKSMGIENAGQLLEAQMVARGRVSLGYLTTFTAIGSYLAGNLTGNGPADKDQRDAWLATGWRPRSLKVGDSWISYTALEPFASFLSLVADIGDNSGSLGEAATQNLYAKAGFLVAQNLTNKSFLSGVVDLGDFITSIQKEGVSGRTAANLINGVLPWAGARRQLANLMNPGIAELDRDLSSTLDRLKAANPVLKGGIPLKFDILTGQPLGWQSPLEGMLGAVGFRTSPDVNNPTRQTLRDLAYPVDRHFRELNGVRLNPKQRSDMQRLIGQNGQLEKDLERFFARPDVQEELRQYGILRQKGVPNRDSRAGGDPISGLDIESSSIYSGLNRIFTTHTRRAQAQLQRDYPSLRRVAMASRAQEQLQRRGQPSRAALRAREQAQQAQIQSLAEYQNK